MRLVQKRLEVTTPANFSSEQLVTLYEAYVVTGGSETQRGLHSAEGTVSTRALGEEARAALRRAREWGFAREMLEEGVVGEGSRAEGQGLGAAN